MSLTTVYMSYIHLSFFRLFWSQYKRILLTTNHLSNFLRNEASHISKCSRFLILILKVSVLIFKKCNKWDYFSNRYACLDRYSYFLKHHLIYHNGLRSLLLIPIHSAVKPERFSLFLCPKQYLNHCTLWGFQWERVGKYCSYPLLRNEWPQT